MTCDHFKTFSLACSENDTNAIWASAIRHYRICKSCRDWADKERRDYPKLGDKAVIDILGRVLCDPEACTVLLGD